MAKAEHVSRLNIRFLTTIPARHAAIISTLGFVDSQMDMRAPHYATTAASYEAFLVFAYNRESCLVMLVQMTTSDRRRTTPTPSLWQKKDDDKRVHHDCIMSLVCCRDWSSTMAVVGTIIPGS